ncbi:glycoside hydrolase family 3 C-terminal domain-containing protein [Streptomyces sp. NBC_01477]|uniref:glycoside hydrolase family 3 C-terminal domain-containing protein n=1 Tax=Streptomyces sp. NBC_01477 TaxID=2976015 RepID=UPI002E352FFB|nr:glycoside hydrolase family 3 C-terminal domain-containing protein [Streptomyces sp. NBC_01477]
MSTVSVPAELPAEPPADQPPFRDPALPLGERVDDLLSRLTPAERIAMLHQYGPAVPRLGMRPFRTGTEALHGVGWLGPATTFPQAVGLGATWDDELLHAVGTATSTELRAFHHHRAPALGAGRHSLQAWAPVVNLLRDPRWGRNEEGYSEDALLSARLGDAFCRGMSGDDPEQLRTAPILKHFLAYNNEDDRTTTSSGVRPRVLHEYDLAAFRQAVATGSATGVMAAYNLVNGRPCHVSPLLESELRRWAEPTGHELFVVSDAEAPSNLVDPEHYFEDHAASHAAALKAGIDSFTDHGEDTATTFGRISEALGRGLLTAADIDRAVRRQLSIRFRLGEFDPGQGPYADTGWEAVDSPGHRALALRAATESIVLLKNGPGAADPDRSLLPLAADGRRIAVVGPLADSLFEDWYSGTMPYRVTAADGLRLAVGARGGETTVVEGVDRIALRAASTGGLLTAAGADARLVVADTQVGDEAAQFDLFDWDLGILTLRNARTGRYAGLVDEDRSLAADRVQPAGWDVHETFRLEPQGDGTEALRSVCSGRYAVLDPASGAVTMAAADASGAERFTRTVVRDGVAEAVAAAGGADAVVLVVGNDPHINGRETQDRAGITLAPAHERLLREVVAARPETVLVVMSSYPYAVDWADAHVPAVLWTSHGGQETGRALAAVLLGDADPAGRLPQTWYRADDELPGRLDYDIIKAGWTYQYHRAAPLYAFGHGLSYTDFALTDLALDRSRIPQDGTATATVTITNSGTRQGIGTVQLYVRAVGAVGYEAPRLKLAGYRKVRLAPGASARVGFPLAADALAHWSVSAGDFTVEAGNYEVLVGRSAADLPLSAPLTVSGPPPAPREVVGRPVRAVDFDDYADVILVDATPTEGDAVTPSGPSGTLHYRAADLDGARTFTAEVSRTAEGPARLEVWAGATLLATVPVPSTGARYAWTTARADLPAATSGVHELRLVLRGEQRVRAFRFDA